MSGTDGDVVIADWRRLLARSMLFMNKETE